MTKALTKSENVATIKDLLDKNRDRIAQALPKGMDIQRYTRIISNAINQSPKLQLCSARSVIMSIMESAQLGLELNSQLGHAYLIPWKDKTGGYYASYIIGYRGILRLIYNSGEVSSVKAVPVYTWDDWDYEEGSETRIKHHPKMPGSIPKAADLVAVYSVASITGRDKEYVWMWKVEVDGIRARSKAQKSGPWVTDYIEMAKKTVIRKHGKTLPMSPDKQLALQREEGRELGFIHPMDTSDVPMIEASDEDIEVDANGSDEKSPETTADLRDRLAKAESDKKATQDAKVPDLKEKKDKPAEEPAAKAPAAKEPAKSSSVAAPARGVAILEGGGFAYAPEQFPKDLPPIDYKDTFREFALMWKKERLVEWEERFKHLVLNTYGSLWPVRHQGGFAALWQQKFKTNYFLTQANTPDEKPAAAPRGQEKPAEPEIPIDTAEAPGKTASEAAPPNGVESDRMQAEYKLYKAELAPADLISLLEAFGVDRFSDLEDNDKAAMLKNCSRLLDGKGD